MAGILGKLAKMKCILLFDTEGVHSATVGKLKICVLKQKFCVQNARIENLTPRSSDLQTVVKPNASSQGSEIGNWWFPQPLGHHRGKHQCPQMSFRPPTRPGDRDKIGVSIPTAQVTRS